MLPPALNEAELDGAQSAGAIRERGGRIAGMLFIAGGVAGTPALALHQDAFPPTVLLLTVLAIVSGTACLLAPWQRLSNGWLHVVGVVASLEVFAVAQTIDSVFCWYFILVVVWAAYVFRTRAEVAAQVAFTVALMFTCAAIDGTQAVVYMLVAVPVVLTTTVLVWTLRDQLERGQAGYRLLARRDPLTGVGNFRELEEALAAEIHRHELSRRRFALTLFDLDGFKQVNDRHGHLEGNRVLREVAEVLVHTVRRGDLVARHGGDEFAIVSPETGEAEARDLGLRLEQAISRLVVGDEPLRASTGCAIYPDSGDDSDRLLGAADTALRREKRARHAIAHPPAPSDTLSANS